MVKRKIPWRTTARRMNAASLARTARDTPASRWSTAWRTSQGDQTWNRLVSRIETAPKKRAVLWRLRYGRRWRRAPMAGSPWTREARGESA